MDVADLKRALVEVSDICKKLTGCNGCPFDTGKWFCPIHELPNRWDIDDWKEDSNG